MNIKLNDEVLVKGRVRGMGEQGNVYVYQVEIPQIGIITVPRSYIEIKEIREYKVIDAKEGKKGHWK